MVETNGTGKNEIAINKPTIFNGDRTKAKAFLQECYIYLNINSDIYDTENKKIAFILSFCNKKEAKLWKEQYLTSKTKENKTIEWDTLRTFLDKFNDVFTPVDETRSAMNKIYKLRQTPEVEVETIITKFKLLVGQANLGMETDLDHAHLIGLFQKVLLPSLTNKIMHSDDFPKTIQGWYKKAIQFDTNFRLAQTFRDETKTRRKTVRWNNYPRNTRDSGTSNKMDTNTMTAEEQTELIKKGACFRYRQQGHLSRDCPQKEQMNQNRNQGQQNKKWTLKELHAHIRSLNNDERDELTNLMVKMRLKENKGF
ncbi:hypothetical protein CVT25_010687 [Psilocybe cyanescens]|uniref:Retrotransposon gag domain-containing protein n=1 Tax=Psilocybe cyanescens TaxID=93625 RepID=A0A409WJZ2_PSICY|nr:hypothetical protein CVT25_010687 [Psilocybe cyanescens]